MKIQTLSCERAQELKEKYQVSSLCAKVLAAKGLSEQEIMELLSSAELKDPFEAIGMKEIADRLYQAKSKQEKVLVCGDYDADGICSTAILVDALRTYGIDCGFYIPNRFKEGYGLSAKTVVMADEKGYSLLITVDNGVKAMDALQEAQKRSLDVIVTDHHAMDEEVPCLYLLHPFQMGEAFATLSGAGVALEISRALLGEKKEHVVLACVAAIADVMPLRKETRAIVKLGIQYLKQGICQPIQRLANDRYPIWDEQLIAYQIVPKLNVTGRLADMVNVNNTVRYLLLRNLEEIQSVAKQISELNEKRKVMSDEMLVTAKGLVHDEYRFQLLFDDSFHEGMVGLVAGKLAEELHQPVMVAARNDAMFKGSIRSGGIVDLTTFFHDGKDLLDSFGGHKAAAGIGFTYDKKQLVQDYVNTRMQDITFDVEASYDVIQADENDLTLSEIESLQCLAPFGAGFEEPLFLFENLAIEECKALRNALHTKWIINDQCEAMYFRSQNAYETLKDQKRVSFIGNVRINTFMRKKKAAIYVVEAY